MNRTTSLFLAFGILLAHALVVHQTDTGGFGGTLDEAHVAFRVARNLFRDGFASWNPETPSFDAYPSPLWILVSWLPERLYKDPTRFCQLVGIICALVTTVFVSRFSRNRMAGILAPFLLVFSGAFVSAAASGTEASALALFMTLSFFSMEHRHPRLLALSLLLTATTRPDGCVFAVAIFLLGLMRRKQASESSSIAMHLSIVPALIAVFGIAWLRNSMTGHWLSPTSTAMGEFDSERAALGWSYLTDFLLKSGSAFLLVFPIAMAFWGKLGKTAQRGLVLVFVWFATVILTGGTSQAFWLAMSPILPILFVTVQEGMTSAIDAERTGLSAVTWTGFLLALVMSAMVSKKPGNIGSIALADAHFAALESSPRLSSAYYRIHGRESEREALRLNARMGAIGRFLHQELNPSYGIVTPWPGTVGYYSRRKIHDLLGRTSIAAGNSRLNSWFGKARIDLVKLLESRPDHLLLNFASLEQSPPPHKMLGEWLEAWDIVGDTPERRLTASKLLAHYNLVTIPIRDQSGDLGLVRMAPFFLLRSKGTGLDPILEIRQTKREIFRIIVAHHGYALVADLKVVVIDSQGTRWSLRPTGEFTRETDVLARSGLHLFQAGSRTLELIRLTIPSELDAVEIIATLHNPGAEKGNVFSLVGEMTRLELDRAKRD